jgi:hypothetical protein
MTKIKDENTYSQLKDKNTALFDETFDSRGHHVCHMGLIVPWIASACFLVYYHWVQESNVKKVFLSAICSHPPA